MCETTAGYQILWNQLYMWQLLSSMFNAAGTSIARTASCTDHKGCFNSQEMFHHLCNFIVSFRVVLDVVQVVSSENWNTFSNDLNAVHRLSLLSFVFMSLVFVFFVCLIVRMFDTVICYGNFQRFLAISSNRIAIYLTYLHHIPQYTFRYCFVHGVLYSTSYSLVSTVVYIWSLSHFITYLVDNSCS